MKASKLLHQARARGGLSQRELSALTGVPQPMISAIERGLQDPRHGTLDKLLHACGQEVDLVLRGGEGVDPTQFIPGLKTSFQSRLRTAVESAKNLERFRRSVRLEK